MKGILVLTQQQEDQLNKLLGSKKKRLNTANIIIILANILIMSFIIWIIGLINIIDKEVSQRILIITGFLGLIFEIISFINPLKKLQISKEEIDPDIIPNITMPQLKIIGNPNKVKIKRFNQLYRLLGVLEIFFSVIILVLLN